MSVRVPRTAIHMLTSNLTTVLTSWDPVIKLYILIARNAAARKILMDCIFNLLIKSVSTLIYIVLYYIFLKSDNIISYKIRKTSYNQLPTSYNQQQTRITNIPKPVRLMVISIWLHTGRTK